MTREDRENEIADYVRFLDAVVSEVAEAIGASPRLTVFGFSQGAQTVCRWVAASNATVERIILWGGYPPHDLDLERGIGRMKSAEVILVRGRVFLRGRPFFPGGEAPGVGNPFRDPDAHG